MATMAKERRQRRNFTDEFKARAVRLVLVESKKIAQVARDLDLTVEVELFSDTRSAGLVQDQLANATS